MVTPQAHREDLELELKVITKAVEELRPSPTIQETIPSLSADDYKRLKDDIAERGIQVPLDNSADGEIICGYKGM